MVLDPDAEFPSSKAPQRRILKACVLIIAIAILMVEVILITVAHISSRPKSPIQTQELSLQYSFTNKSDYISCGDTEETALARGCKFDYLTISWETPECYHADIVDSFFSVEEWKYYNDSSGTPIPPQSSITDGHQRWNVKWAFHFTHCVYTWKIMQKAVLERRPIPDNLLDLGHTRHCMEIMLDKRFAWEDMHTMVHVKWPKCARFEEWDKAKWVENLVLPN